jgi:CRISPR system Cascade subunit CasB
MNDDDKKLVDGASIWWATIRPRDGYDPYKGDRADLRRCHTIDDVMFVPVYHLLLEKADVDRGNAEQLKSLAVVAWVLSWVQSESEQTFARQLATCDPEFKDIRFRRILETKDWTDLGFQLIRAVRFVKRCANVSSLIRGILFWNRSSYMKEQWALDYYQLSRNEKTN